MLGIMTSAAGHGSQIAKYAVVNLKRSTIPTVPFPAPYPPGCSGESAHTSSLDYLFPFRQSKEQPAGPEDITWELARYKVDFAAMSETQFS
ncbi:unnamed protein product [Schistocephalus solidus]|uniref:Uncharacterized protein n=1 Tax=Schistocephalus solidus TaxID=70667 RepID=A0A183TL46_SCHSO|nr:unnamed protein product [Schistocephalus solidus]